MKIAIHFVCHESWPHEFSSIWSAIFNKFLRRNLSLTDEVRLFLQWTTRNCEGAPTVSREKLLRWLQNVPHLENIWVCPFDKKILEIIFLSSLFVNDPFINDCVYLLHEHKAPIKVIPEAPPIHYYWYLWVKITSDFIALSPHEVHYFLVTNQIPKVQNSSMWGLLQHSPYHIKNPRYIYWYIYNHQCYYYSRVRTYPRSNASQGNPTNREINGSFLLNIICESLSIIHSLNINNCA